MVVSKLTLGLLLLQDMYDTLGSFQFLRVRFCAPHGLRNPVSLKKEHLSTCLGGSETPEKKNIELLEGYRVELPPTQDSSHHQDYSIFSGESL